jgi:hypothetical protein
MHSMGMMFRMWQLLSSQSVIVVSHDTKCDLSFPSLELEWVRKTLMENSCHATCSWMSCQIEGCKLNVMSYWSLCHVLLETQICKVRNLGKWNIGIKTSNARITSKCEHERERERERESLCLFVLSKLAIYVRILGSSSSVMALI